MLKAMKLEIKPNKTQRTLINKTCGCTRLVFNLMLAEKIKVYKETNNSISSYDLIKKLPKLKEEKEFLQEVPSQALQQSILDLDRAYKNFFKRGNKGFPKFKKKNINDSFRIPIPCEINYDNWTVKLAKLGTVKIFKGHNKQIKGKIKSYTIKHTNTNRYFISILYETAEVSKCKNNKAVGIDVGIKTFATLSDGRVFENQKYLKSNLKKLRVLQRAVSRKYQKGKGRDEQSKNWKKAIKRVAKLHEHISFQRQDFLHKVSKYISDNYSTVCVETLNVKEMIKNKHLSQAISDCAWGKFIEFLEYKCNNLVKVDKWYASSQTCSSCGFVNSEVKNLAIRTWTCPKCGEVHDRDLNASRNILRTGLALCTLSSSKEGFVQNPTTLVVGESQ